MEGGNKLSTNNDFQINEDMIEKNEKDLEKNKLASDSIDSKVDDEIQIDDTNTEDNAENTVEEAVEDTLLDPEQERIMKITARLEDKEYKMSTLKLALYLGELLIKNGAETYRVEDSVIRICKSRGYNHINCFTTPTVLIISDDKFDGLCFMKTINSRGINLHKIALLNNFSRDFVNKIDPDINEEIKELRQIDKEKGYPTWLYLAGTGIGSASFAAILGGNQILTYILTFLTSILATYIYDKTIKYSSIVMFSTILSSVIITSIGVFFHKIGYIDTPSALIVGSIMPLIPGVAFIKSMRDLISGNLMAGTARLFEVFMIFTAIAFGVAVILGIGGI